MSQGETSGGSKPSDQGDELSPWKATKGEARGGNRWLTPLMAIVGLAAGWFLYLKIVQPTAPSPSILPPAILATDRPGRVLDTNWPLVDLEGNRVDLAQFKGRPMFLNLWATWCPPCRAEMPAIDRLAGMERLDDVAFACISFDRTAEPVRRYVADTGLKVPVYVMAGDPPEGFDPQGFPTTLIVAKDGTIAAEELGAAQWDSTRVVMFLEDLSKR